MSDGTIRAGSIPGTVNDYAITSGMKVGEFLDVQEMDAEGKDIRVNSQPANRETVLRPGDTLIMTKAVKGA